MKNYIRLSVCLLLAFPLGFSSEAIICAASGAGARAHHAKARHHCPRCQATGCELKVEQVDEEKYCWKVECETICIPRVVFPWQKNCCDPCVNNGAWTRKVNVLKKHEYTCPACKYSWTPVDRGCCGVGCGNHGCVACDGMPIDMGISVQEQPSVQQQPSVPMPPALHDQPAAFEPTPADGASLEPTEAGFVEHQKVKVVSFVSKFLGK